MKAGIFSKGPTAMAGLMIPAFLLSFSLAETASIPPVALTSKDGKPLEATIISLSGTAVKVRRKDGKEFDIPLERLTEASIAAAKANVPKPKPAKVPEKPRHPDEIPDKVVIKIGSKSAATFTVTDGKLHAPVALDADPCFTVDFKAEENLIIATVKQTILPAVKVRCLARIKGRKDYFPTSILPLQNGLPCFESWGDNLEELVFFGWEETEAMKR